MRFKVEYVNKKTIETYWRTIDAEDHVHAVLLADKYAKKGFNRVYMEQVFNKGE